MPSRHISSQSFDDILSDLGDDPAIPDPHGIRKNPTTSKAQFTKPINSKPGFLPEISTPFNFNSRWFLLTFGGIVVSLSFGLFWVFESQKSDSQESLIEINKQIDALKNELVDSIQNWENNQDELYEILEE